MSVLCGEGHEFVDYAIYLDAPEDEPLRIRLKRDVEERGYTREEVLRNFERLKQDYREHLEPPKAVACVNTGDFGGMVSFV